ncbi:MAG: Fe-S cluster assembly protein HesB [marine benthic group bacterium]|nr:Fe-S cluster assembly protein HesB [Candidatus Benthicola marisminoris]
MTQRGTMGKATTHRTEITTAAPVPFDFAGTVYSHGWAVLEPNRWHPDRSVLTRTERLGPGRVVYVTLASAGNSEKPRVRVGVEHGGELTRQEAATIRRSVRVMLRLDEDLRPFHELCRRAGPRWREAAAGLGRLIRSPTVFEDAIKTICTTNVQWSGTKGMIQRLVQVLGEPGPLSAPADAGLPAAFPTPEVIAAADGSTLDQVRLGYRAPYIRELSERVASGDLDLDALREPDASTEEVRRILLDIKGVGSYAAATLLMFLGRYDYLAIDSVYRTFVTSRYFGGHAVSDSEAAGVYADWGRWKYLGFWFDLWKGLDEEV